MHKTFTYAIKFYTMNKTVTRMLLLSLLGLFLSCDDKDTIEENVIEENPPTVYEGWTLQWNDEFNK